MENYIILMIIAWTKLFHAFFQATIGGKYYYKEKNGHYKIVDGERKAWELKECIKNYQKLNHEHPLSDPVIANLQFFIGIRNKIEHRLWSSSELDIILFGECQSLLYNYETLLISLFGDTYSVNACLAYALQFSHYRPATQVVSQKTLLSKDMLDIKKYIDKYRTDLPQSVFDSQEFSIKLLQIPKVSNTNRTDLSIEFVRWSELDENDIANYRKVTTIIKDKLVKQKVSNANLLKPSNVIKAVEKKAHVKINISLHTLLWKAFSVRPLSDSEDKFNTNDKYCIYDEPHNDYLYTEEWVDFVVNLIHNYGFTREVIMSRCKEKLQIDDYI